MKNERRRGEIRAAFLVGVTLLAHLTLATAALALGYNPGVLSDGTYDPSFESTTEKWTYTSTGSTYGSTTDPAYDGSKTFRSTSLTTAYSGRTLRTNDFVAVTAGNSYKLEVGWYASGTEWADNRLEINIEWYDSSDTLLSTSTASDLALTAQSTWTLKTLTDTAPTGAIKAKVLVRWKRTSATTTGRQQSFDRVALLDLTSPTSVPNPPTPLSPVDNAETTNVFPVFSWLHNDTTSTPQAAYHLQIARTSDFASILLEDSGASSSTTKRLTTPLPPPADTAFFWRVRTSNVALDYSAFSEVEAFRLNNLVENPSLDRWAGPLVSDEADSWTKLNSTTSNYVRQTSDTVLSGVKALLFMSPTTAFARGIESQSPFAITADSGYRIAARAQKNNAQLTSGAYDLRLQLDWLDETGTLIATSSHTQAFAAFDAWELAEADTLTPPPGAAKARLRVQARRTGGSAMTSDHVYIDDVFVRNVGYVPYQDPGAPQNLTAAGNPFVNDLAWSAASAGSFPIAKYVIRRSSGGSGYADLAEVAATALAYGDSAVTVGVQYHYVVLARDEAGVLGDSSNQATVVAQGYADPPPLGTNIQINEIMFDPAGSEPANEWVELYNPTDTPISIGGLLFEDNATSFTIPTGESVPAKGYYILGYSITAAGGNVDMIYGSSSPNLQFANTADTVRLRTETQLVDEVGYISSSWGGNEPYSLSRKFSGGASQEITNWGRAQASGGTPRAANDVDTLPPLITHTPKARAADHLDLGILSQISDNIDKEIELGRAWLFYRTQGETEYTQLTMNRTAILDWYGLIPAVSVETPVLEYYIEAMDGSNNLGRFGHPDTPQQVTVVVIDTKVVVNEIMYDPAGAEPAEEWVELYNYGSTALSLNGWSFGNGRDVVTLPPSASVPAGGYLVLKYSDSAAPGVPGITYGETAAIQFRNLLAVVTDKVELADPTGLVVDEVNYSSTWGAMNVGGPVNHTLERIRPTGSSNSQSNWLYAYEQGGTPGETNTSKIVRNVMMNPTYFNPLIGETTRITFEVRVDSEIANNTAAVTIRIRNSDGVVIRTIQMEDAPSPGTHLYDTTWNGLNDDGDSYLDILFVEVEAVDRKGEMSLHKVDDRPLLGYNDQYSTQQPYTGGQQVVGVAYYLDRPSFMSITIKDADGPTGNVVRKLIDSEPVGAGNQRTLWDLRKDNGAFHLGITSWLFQAVPFVGNALISQQPFGIGGETVTPTMDFKPQEGETLTIWYRTGDTSYVTARVRKEDGALVRTLFSGSLLSFGSHVLTWDGKDDLEAYVNVGAYLVIIEGVTEEGWQKSRFVRKIGVK